MKTPSKSKTQCKPASKTRCCTPDRIDDAPSNATDGLSRRDFVTATGIATAAAMVGGLPVKLVWAEDGRPFEHLIPPDKGLDPTWIRSLYERGTPETHRGWAEQLQYIGMPVGGICCGQLYLGGDGRLWLWDIFKCNYRSGATSMQLAREDGHYAKPIPFGEEYSPQNGADVMQGVALRIRHEDGVVVRTLDHRGFPGVTFRGEYPVGKVSYRDDDLPVEIDLEAFSPFIPLKAKDSALPATILRYTLTNTSDSEVDVDLAGWMENKTATYLTDNRFAKLGRRRNQIAQGHSRVSVLSTVEPLSDTGERKDIIFADFEGNDWGAWQAEGDAFRGGPFPASELAPVQDSENYVGKRFVNSFNTRVSGGRNADNLQGTLTSPPFTIERKLVSLRIAGGNRPDDVFVEVVVDGKSVGKVTGRRNNRLRPAVINVERYEGKQAHIRIVDRATGSWGQLAVDQIVFADRPPRPGVDQSHGYGSTALSLLLDGDEGNVSAAVDLDLRDILDPARLFEALGPLHQKSAARPLNEKLVGALGTSFALREGESKTIELAVTWYFPDYMEPSPGSASLASMSGFSDLRRHYAPWFASAGDVAQRLSDERRWLIDTTLLWNRTWYDSTLPYWLLDRSFIAIDCLASQTSHWLDNGRFWGWEGVDCCAGTCQHVWQYAQALSRIFPEIERDLRTRIDFGLAQRADGSTAYRGPDTAGRYGLKLAHDGHLGRILGAYREHLTSADDAYLRDIYPRLRLAMRHIIDQDGNREGLLRGRQSHTLDATWVGPMGWLSSLYLAALRACETMAGLMNDPDFAGECRTLIDRGSENIVAELFDGEYFIHKPTDLDKPTRYRRLNSNKGCHIDQVLGEAWGRQVGLPRVIPKAETVSALRSLWRYNFAPDAGGYALKHREIEQMFRWYAMEGEAGMLMCTWPKGGAIDAIPGDGLRPLVNPRYGAGGYFNECMTGFEHQVAAHMVYEGEAGSDLVEKGLAVIRAIHDRYAAHKRNPYNEIECSDHYARAMASYGVFLASCGFEYDGPAGYMAFAPRLTPEDFRAPFTAAEGWGTYQQQVDDDRLEAALTVAWGQLTLQRIGLQIPEDVNARQVFVDGRPVSFEREDGETTKRIVARFKKTTLKPNQPLEIVVC